MAQPFTATWRITMPYSVTGVQHVMRVYVNSTGALAGGITQLINRTGGLANWTALVSEFDTAVFNNLFQDNETSMGIALLENLSGIIWNPVDSVAMAALVNSVAAPVYASQNTVVLRDTTFDKLKIEYMEASVPIPYHTETPPASGIMQSASAPFLSNYTAMAPFNYVVSRSTGYIKATGAFVGQTGTLNRKLRRARGFA